MNYFYLLIGVICIVLLSCNSNNCDLKRDEVWVIDSMFINNRTARIDTFNSNFFWVGIDGRIELPKSRYFIYYAGKRKGKILSSYEIDSLSFTNYTIDGGVKPDECLLEFENNMSIFKGKYTVNKSGRNGILYNDTIKCYFRITLF